MDETNKKWITAMWLLDPFFVEGFLEEDDGIDREDGFTLKETIEGMEPVVARNADFNTWMAFILLHAKHDLNAYGDIVFDVFGCSHCLKKSVFGQEVDEALNKAGL